VQGWVRRRQRGGAPLVGDGCLGEDVHGWARQGRRGCGGVCGGCSAWWRYALYPAQCHASILLQALKT
jgi:hypothetical protein